MSEIFFFNYICVSTKSQLRFLDSFSFTNFHVSCTFFIFFGSPEIIAPSLSLTHEIISLSKKEKCELSYPEDVLVSKDLNGSYKKKELNEILNDEMILDIGPKTIYKITNIINSSKTILWNGPAGYFENPNFANGSIEIAKTIIKNNKLNKIFSVVGGGDTVSLLNNIKAVDGFNFVSTAGGAFLEYLEGKNLPGITALN